MRGNDVIVTAPAMSWLVLRGALLATVLGGAAALISIPGWFFAAVVCGAIAAVLPASYAAWGSIACIVVGMLIAGPDLGRALLAVLLVHLIHTLGALALLVPRGARIVLAALRPSLVRFVLIQVAAQPLTLAVMALFVLGTRAEPWAAVVGGAALVGAVVLLLVRFRRAQAPLGRR